MTRPEPEDIDREALASFLDSEGGVALLIIVSGGGARYNEIEEQMLASNSTFELRRAQAVELNLIDKETRQTDDGLEGFYVLTPLGKAVRRWIHRRKMDKVYWQLQQLNQQYDEMNDDLVDWAKTEDSSLEIWYQSLFQNRDQDEPFDDRDYFWEE